MRGLLAVDEVRTAYDVMFEAQDGKCAICGKKSPRQKFDRDHDHQLEKETGLRVYRGLLCRRCNIGVGRFEWSDDVLENAIKYFQMIIKLRKESRLG